MATRINRFGFAAYLGTLFGGAFNDNVFKLLLLCYASNFLGQGNPATKLYVPLAGALFVVPFLLFSSYAGYLADRFSKRKVMIGTKVAEVLIMLSGVFFFAQQRLYWLLAVLFVMGAQSAFFSPAKYGFMPETLPETALSRANGATQLFTFLAIILGSWAGGALAAWSGPQPHRAAWFCVVIAIAGLALSFGITPTRPGNLTVRLKLDPLISHLRTLLEMRRDRLLWLSLLGNTFFWFLAALFQLTLLFLAKDTLGGDDRLVGYLQAAVALGIGAGCGLAGLISRHKIEYGLIIPGGIMTGLCCCLLGISGGNLPGAYLFSAALGFSAGFYQLPLVTAIQKRSPQRCRGRYLGASNALDCLSMMLASLVQWLLLKVLAFDAQGVFVCAGVLTLGAVAIIARKAPTLWQRSRAIRW